MPAKIPTPDLIEEMQDFEEKHGTVSVPQWKEADTQASYVTYINRFDSWENAKKQAGVDQYDPTKEKYSKQDIIDHVHRIKEEIGRTPRQKDFTEDEKAPSPVTAVNKWDGSWHTVLKKSGLQPNRAKSTTYPELRDREWLYQKYKEEGFSTHNIALLLGCYSNTVSFWLRKHGIETDRPARSTKVMLERQREKLEELEIMHCLLCGDNIRDNPREACLHHIRPSSLGGSDNIENLAPLCFTCHREKAHAGAWIKLDLQVTRELVEKHPLAEKEKYQELLEEERVVELAKF